MTSRGTQSPRSVSASGTGVRGGDQLSEGAPADVPQKAGGVRAEAAHTGAADQQDPPTVPESTG